MMVDQALGHARLPGDLAHGSGGRTMADEEILGRFENRPARGFRISAPTRLGSVRVGVRVVGSLGKEDGHECSGLRFEEKISGKGIHIGRTN